MERDNRESSGGREMKILMGGATPWLSTGYGVVVRHVAPYLASLGHEVVLFSSAYRGEEVRWQGIRILGTYEGAKYSSVYSERRLFESIDKEKPDLLFVVGDILLLEPVFKYKEQGKFKILAYFPIDSDPWRPAEIEYLKYIDYPVVPSNFGRRALEKLGYTARVIPHGIDTEVFRPLDMDKLELKREYGVEEKFVYLYVGTNNSRKNVAGLLEAFRMVKEKVEDVVLCLCTCHRDSSGYDLPAIIKDRGLEEYVYFPDYINSFSLTTKELVQLYNASDVFVSATMGEGFSLCHLEAMSCGLPIVSPNNSALTELLEGVGILTECKGYYIDTFGAWKSIPVLEKLAEGMLTLYHDASLREELSRKGLERAKSYDWSKILTEWKVVMEEVET